MTQPKRRGTCQICGYRWGLMGDGNLRQHWIWSGLEGQICKGSHQFSVEAIRLMGVTPTVVKAG